MPNFSVKSWTREDVAGFLLRNRETIIGKLKDRFGRIPGGSESEVFSSVARRIDGMALRGKLCPKDEGELWGLILTIGSNYSISRSRAVQRLASLCQEDGDYCRRLSTQMERCSDDDAAAALLIEVGMWLSSDERSLWWLRMRGASHSLIAGQLSITPEAARQRWVTMLRRIQQAFEDGVFDDR